MKRILDRRTGLAGFTGWGFDRINRINRIYGILDRRAGWAVGFFRAWVRDFMLPSERQPYLRIFMNVIFLILLILSIMSKTLLFFPVPPGNPVILSIPYGVGSGMRVVKVLVCLR